jgi:NAD kinase
MVHPLSPLFIVTQLCPCSLSEVYNTIGYYLRHQSAVETYLSQREQLANAVQQRLSSVQPDFYHCERGRKT